MSGHGRWQQLLIQALDEREVVGVRAIIEEHLGRRPTRSEITAARRSALKLGQVGAAAIAHVRVRSGEQRAGDMLVLVRADSVADEETLRRAAVGSPTAVVPEEEQRRLTVDGVAGVLERVGKAARLARSVDVDLLDPNQASESAKQLSDAVIELTHLRRRLQRRGRR